MAACFWFLDDESTHDTLRDRPVTFGLIGVLHTLLSAGIVFGWASLLPILRQEGLELSPSQFASIFTHGAVGNYLSSLPFGLVLDKCGPKLCGMIASFLFALGLLLCSLSTSCSLCFDVGFALMGFSGPGIQLPTLHLARLYPGTAREGGSGGAAIFMSAQAGAFDGGTMVFAIYSVIFRLFRVPSTVFFRVYLIVPTLTFLTALFFWPNTILPDSTVSNAKRRSNSYIGAGSPYLSPATMLSATQRTMTPASSILKDAPLSLVLSRKQFYCLAIWVSVHVLKLNFVVATLNDQLSLAVSEDSANVLISIFGAMLPFGFVVLPFVAALLARSSFACFQVANAIGILYGAVMRFFPEVPALQILIVFTAVATSRQLVYSTVFHQTGEVFGFRHYGVLLGLINILVSAVSLVQVPLVEWSESSKSYQNANFILMMITFPMIGVSFGTRLPASPSDQTVDQVHRSVTFDKELPMNESTLLIPPAVSRPRSHSTGLTVA